MKWRAYIAIYWKATFVSCNREDKMKFCRKMHKAVYRWVRDRISSAWWVQVEMENVVAMVRFNGPWKTVKFYAAHRSRRWWSLDQLYQCTQLRSQAFHSPCRPGLSKRPAKEKIMKEKPVMNPIEQALLNFGYNRSPNDNLDWIDWLRFVKGLYRVCRSFTKVLQRFYKPYTNSQYRTCQVIVMSSYFMSRRRRSQMTILQHFGLLMAILGINAMLTAPCLLYAGIGGIGGMLFLINTSPKSPKKGRIA